MNLRRLPTARALVRALGLATVTAAAIGTGTGADAADASGAPATMRPAQVFTSSNAVAGNELLVYTRNGDGTLALAAHLPTQGLGSGAGLGSQGAVTLSGDGRYLFVVNAASNTVSTFSVRTDGLTLASVVASGGLHPISVTENDGLVYVLNDQGEGNVAGYRNERGQLRPLAGAVRSLSAAGGTTPAQVAFGAGGEVLVVTEKGTNRLTTYRVREQGGLGEPVVTAASGLTPFGFGFDRRDHLFVSEAFGGAPGASAVSSYRFEALAPARPVGVSASVGTTQTSACWLAVAPGGKFLYTANTGSGTVSSYRIERSGRIVLLDPAAGNVGAGSTPIDLAFSADGGHLFVLGSGSHTIAAFTAQEDGSLTADPGVAGLAPGTVGMAAD